MIRIGLILLVFPCLLLMGLYLPEQSSAADCVANGGSFNYQDGICDTENNHPYSPFMARNTLLVNASMLIALLGCLICIFGLYQPRKVR
jgi:hypothetical protein